MHVYVDTSALLKRVISEDESTALIDFLDDRERDGDLLASSSLAWIELSRAIRSRFQVPPMQLANAVEEAMSGVDERPIGPDVVSLARRVDPNVLRSLDAIHLASAVLIDADLVLTYDTRLADACTRNALQVTSPGR